MQDRKYRFSWDQLGDIEKGRPNLGNSVRLEAYRLMQFACRDVMEQQLGTDQTDRIFYQAGKLAGLEFARHLLPKIEDFNEFIKALQQTVREMGIGILRIEEADLVKGSLILTVGEDLDCSGLPETGYMVCVYDEGFIAGLLESFTGRPFKVKEVDCWSTGERICRFKADVTE